MRRSSSVRCALAASALALLAAVGVPAAAVAAPAATATVAAAVCTVTDATLTWGFKESFRSYISGTIAHGEWEPIDGATYDTPEFTWAGGAGEIAADGASGEVSFPGGVRFTGHDGLLDTTIAHPTLVLGSGGDAVLRLDVSGVSMENALAGDDTVDTAQQVDFVTVDLGAADLATDGGVLSLATDAAATAITQDGFDAFGNYETGTAFDPLTVAITADCPVATPTSGPAATPEDTVDSDSAENDAAADADGAAPGAVPVAVWAAVGGGLVAVLGGIAAAVTATRRRGAAAVDDAEPSASATPGDGTPPGEEQ